MTQDSRIPAGPDNGSQGDGRTRQRLVAQGLREIGKEALEDDLTLLRAVERDAAGSNGKASLQVSLVAWRHCSADPHGDRLVGVNEILLSPLFPWCLLVTAFGFAVLTSIGVLVVVLAQRKRL
jgi:hypothetical protein